MNIASYKDALNYLEGFIGKVVFNIDPKSIKLHPPLDRMKMLLSLLDNPQEKFKSVLVGGTSGKGSTAYLISHILTKAGYKTGFTVSPHLQKINERLQINGKLISDEKFVKLLKSSILPSIREMSKMKVGAPSYFEILIAMAFTYFAKEKVDIAVVEVGMGGEFDGTNTLNPLVAILTNVSLDHTKVLGKTVEEIAKTKAGIIKSDKRQATSDKNKLIVVSGVRQPSVVKIIQERSDRMGAELRLLWRDFGYKIKKESTKGIDFDFISHEETLEGLKLSLLGQYQVTNASLAIKTVLELRKLGFKIPDGVIKRALKSTFFPGRFEIVHIARGPVAPSSRPTSSVASSLRSLDGTPSSRSTPRSHNSQLSTFNSQLILDGAHNPTKMKEFLKSLKKLYPRERKIFLVGFKFDKDIKKMLKEILGAADEVIVTEFKAKTDTKIHASANTADIKNQILKIKKDMKVTVEKNSAKALKKAIKMNPELIVVTGSLYLVGEIRNKL